MTNEHVAIDEHNQQKRVSERIKTINPRFKDYVWARSNI